MVKISFSDCFLLLIQVFFQVSGIVVEIQHWNAINIESTAGLGLTPLNVGGSSWQYLVLAAGQCSYLSNCTLLCEYEGSFSYSTQVFKPEYCVELTEIFVRCWTKEPSKFDHISWI